MNMSDLLYSRNTSECCICLGLVPRANYNCFARRLRGGVSSRDEIVFSHFCPRFERYLAHHVSASFFFGRRQVLVGPGKCHMGYDIEPCRVTALECLALLGIRTQVS